MSNGTTIGLTSSVNCDRYWSAKDFKIYRVFSAFGGLFDCLILDVTALIVCILLFSYLRKRAGNYGRIGLHQRMEEGDLESEMHAYNVWTTMFFTDSPLRTRHSFDRKLLALDVGMFAWIPATFTIKDEDIYKRCGPDALQYLTFQKYLIFYQMLVASTCLTIILPVNFIVGTYEGMSDTFARTTIINIHPDSPYLWIHCALAMFLLCMAIFFMKHFIEHVQFNSEEESKTVMIMGIPVDKCYSHLIDIHFEEAYPECEVADTQFAFNVALLVNLDFERLNAQAALFSVRAHKEETGERLKIMPYSCGAVVHQCCRCCEVCGWRQVDAIDYYTQQLGMYQELCDAEKVNAFHDPLGIVFVTFTHDLMTKRVIRDFRMTWKGRHTPQTSSLSRVLRVKDWTVVTAPSSGDIFWQNLSVGPFLWWVRAVAVNFFILLIVIFFTTPSVFLNQLNRIKGFKSETENNMVLQFVPTLLLTITSTILPVIVSCSDINLVGHYTRTSLNRTIMVKVFMFLLIMLIVLPSVGFSSVGSMIGWLASGHKVFKFSWSCMFVSSNCAFFVNYMMSASTIGIGLDLLRIGDLVFYAVFWALSKSQAERPMIRAYITSEFRYGVCYAWLLCNATVTMSYSIIAPLITIPGVLYLALKHYVDRHNLCYVFKSSRIDNRIHETAINFVMISVFGLQLTILSFILLRTEKITGLAVYSLVTGATMCILFFLTICFGKISVSRQSVDAKWELQQPEFRASETKRRSGDEPEAPVFVPPVLVEDNPPERLPTNPAFARSDVMIANQAEEDTSGLLIADASDTGHPPTNPEPEGK